MVGDEQDAAAILDILPQGGLLRLFVGIIGFSDDEYVVWAQVIVGERVFLRNSFTS